VVAGGGPAIFACFWPGGGNAPGRFDPGGGSARKTISVLPGPGQRRPLSADPAPGTQSARPGSQSGRAGAGRAIVIGVRSGRYAPGLRYAAFPPRTHRLRNSHSERSFKIVLKKGPGAQLQNARPPARAISNTPAAAANPRGAGDPAPGTALPAPTLPIGHTNVKGAPGRTRTDTSDPFRGAASALGLRGLANNTPQFFINEGSRYSDWRVRPTRFIQIAITVGRVQTVTVWSAYINAL
jgi:hypothetical protein